MHIVALFLLLLGVLVLLLGLVVSRGSQDLVDRATADSFVGSAELALQELRRLQETAQAAAEALAADPVVEAGAQPEQAQRLHVMATVLRSVRGLSAAYIGWPSGEFVLLRPLGVGGAGLDPPSGAAWMAQWSGTHGARFDFLDADLTLLETRDRIAHTFDPRIRPWFLQAMAGEGTVVTAPYIFFTTREPGITAARRTTSGAVVGVDISLWELSARLPRGHPVPATAAAILDAGGGVVAYADIERLQAILGAGSPRASASEVEALPAAASLGAPVIAALAERLRGEPGAFLGTLAAGGSDWLATVIPLDDLGTSFVMAAPLADLGAGPRAIRNRLLALLGLALLLSVPVVWLAARRLARPVEAFARSVEKIGELDFTAPPLLGSRVTELSALDESIRDMRASLRDRIQQLRCLYRVLELTSDAARPVPEICAEIVRLLPGSLPADARAVARIRLGSVEFRSDGWQPPAHCLSAPLHASQVDGDFLELGWSVEHGGRAAGIPAGQSTPTGQNALVASVAGHIGHMLRTRQTAAKLTQSERMSAIGQLTGGVAHDFNNLLTVILGNAEMLSERLAGQEELRRLADMSIAAAERGADLTQHLLAFARQQALEPRQVDVNALLAGMDPLLRRTLSEDIDIRTHCTPDLWAAEVDPAQLESALLNLAINARDAMPSGGCLTIETANAVFDDGDAGQLQLEPGRYVLITVSDTGEGMSAAVAARAFEPFFTTKDVGKGNGLGLAMVYGFVKQSRGHVRLYSELGQGTSIKLVFPAAGSAAEALPSPAANQPATGGGEHLLVVEDDEFVRQHLALQLRSLGYRVTLAAAAAEALELLSRTSDVEMLFTDVILAGGMNGRELAVTASARRPGLKVLFASGYAENAILHHGRLPPGVHLVAKPYRRSELAAKVRAALDGIAP